MHAVHRCGVLLQMSHVAWSVSVCVRLWHTGKNAPFGGQTLVSPRSHVLDGGSDPSREGALLRNTCVGTL